MAFRRSVRRRTRPTLIHLAVLTLAVGAARRCPAELVAVPLTSVGSLGNPADTRTGLGAVSHAFAIGAYEITADDYTRFLNAVARADPYGLYDSNPSDMATWRTGPRIQRSGVSGHYTYSVAADYANRPINFISWGDAARFCNWLHNGQPIGPQGPGTTERGSYTLDGATTSELYLAVVRSPSATFVLPTEDEWYKAAYYDPSLSAGNRYWAFATRSNAAPGNQLLDPDPGNNANFYQNGQYSLGGYLRTNVGDFENSFGPWRTYDQMGNVGEWTESVRSGAIAVRGESYSTGDSGGATIGYRFVRAVSPVEEETKNGFRVGFIGPGTFIFVGPGQTLAQSQAGYGALSGTTPVRKTGAGTLVLDSATTLTGDVSIEDGSIVATRQNAIGSASRVDIAADATLDLTGLENGYSVLQGQVLGGEGTVLGSVAFGRGSRLSPGALGAATSTAMDAVAAAAGIERLLPVPEPAALDLIGLGSAFVALVTRRRRRHPQPAGGPAVYSLGSKNIARDG